MSARLGDAAPRGAADVTQSTEQRAPDHPGSTPRPWTTHDDTIIAADSTLVATLPRGGFFVFGEMRCAPAAERAANARLITAAGSLYRACVLALDALYSDELVGSPGGPRDAAVRARRRARGGHARRRSGG